MFRRLRLKWKLWQLSRRVRKMHREFYISQLETKLGEHHNSRCTSIPIAKDDNSVDDAADRLYNASSAYLEKLDSQMTPIEVHRMHIGDWDNSEKE